jgi:hypothetical protein
MRSNLPTFGCAVPFGSTAMQAPNSYMIGSITYIARVVSPYVTASARAKLSGIGVECTRVVRHPTNFALLSKSASSISARIHKRFDMYSKVFKPIRLGEGTAPDLTKLY